MPLNANPFRDITRRRDNPINNLKRVFIKQENRLVTGPLSPPASYIQDSFYLAELQARMTAADRMLTGPEITTYVQEVQAMRWDKWVRSTWPITVLIRPTSMPYYHSSKIVVPSPVRELIVLHEMAHHFAGLGPQPHYPQFVQAFLDLIEGVRNQAQADHFRRVFTEFGVKW